MNELWAEIHGSHKEYIDTRNLLYKKEGCGSAGFSTRYMRKFPDAKDEDALKYVVEHWKKISVYLNIPIDYGKIAKQLNIAMP